MSRRKKRFWVDEDKQEICAQATTPKISVAQVAQVAQRYAVNANLIFKWLKDPRFAPGVDASTQEATFLPVEIEADAVHEPALIGCAPCWMSVNAAYALIRRRRLVGVPEWEFRVVSLNKWSASLGHYKCQVPHTPEFAGRFISLVVLQSLSRAQA